MTYYKLKKNYIFNPFSCLRFEQAFILDNFLNETTIPFNSKLNFLRKNISEKSLDTLIILDFASDIFGIPTKIIEKWLNDTISYEDAITMCKIWAFKYKNDKKDILEKYGKREPINITDKILNEMLIPEDISKIFDKTDSIKENEFKATFLLKHFGNIPDSISNIPQKLLEISINIFTNIKQEYIDYSGIPQNELPISNPTLIENFYKQGKIDLYLIYIGKLQDPFSSFKPKLEKNLEKFLSLSPDKLVESVKNKLTGEQWLELGDIVCRNEGIDWKDISNINIYEKGFEFAWAFYSQISEKDKSYSDALLRKYLLGIKYKPKESLFAYLEGESKFRNKFSFADHKKKVRLALTNIEKRQYKKDDASFVPKINKFLSNNKPELEPSDFQKFGILLYNIAEMQEDIHNGIYLDAVSCLLDALYEKNAKANPYAWYLCYKIHKNIADIAKAIESLSGAVELSPETHYLEELIKTCNTEINRIPSEQVVDISESVQEKIIKENSYAYVNLLPKLKRPFASLTHALESNIDKLTQENIFAITKSLKFTDEQWMELGDVVANKYLRGQK